MIYEDFDVIPLQPTKSEQGKVSAFGKPSMVSKKNKKVKKPKQLSNDTSLIDMLIKQCFVCLIVLGIITMINVIGTVQVFDSVLKIIESRNIGDYFLTSNIV